MGRERDFSHIPIIHVSEPGAGGRTPRRAAEELRGKAVRRSPKATASGRLHLVSAWATENCLILGQQEVAEGSNEIAALPEVPRVLDLKGALVSIDAACPQVDIAQQVRAQEGDYLLPAKGNQPTLLAACERLVGEAFASDLAGLRYDPAERIEEGHGRHEERYVTVIYDPTGLPAEWPDVKAVVCVSREREAQGRSSSSETQLYISSSAGSAKVLGQWERGHWGIENSLRWVLDTVFREDESRTRLGHAGANLGMLRRVATSLLKRAPGEGSIHTKRLKVGWDNDFLL
jgi:predicted transposase YbfD/YdcC